MFLCVCVCVCVCFGLFFCVCLCVRVCVCVEKTKFEQSESCIIMHSFTSKRVAGGLWLCGVVMFPSLVNSSQ